MGEIDNGGSASEAKPIEDAANGIPEMTEIKGSSGGSAEVVVKNGEKITDYSNDEEIVIEDNNGVSENIGMNGNVTVEDLSNGSAEDDPGVKSGVVVDGDEITVKGSQINLEKEMVEKNGISQEKGEENGAPDSGESNGDSQNSESLAIGSEEEDGIVENSVVEVDVKNDQNTLDGVESETENCDGDGHADVVSGGNSQNAEIVLAASEISVVDDKLVAVKDVEKESVEETCVSIENGDGEVKVDDHDDSDSGVPADENRSSQNTHDVKAAIEDVETEVKERCVLVENGEKSLVDDHVVSDTGASIDENGSFHYAGHDVEREEVEESDVSHEHGEGAVNDDGDSGSEVLTDAAQLNGDSQNDPDDCEGIETEAVDKSCTSYENRAGQVVSEDNSTSRHVESLPNGSAEDEASIQTSVVDKTKSVKVAVESDGIDDRGTKTGLQIEEEKDPVGDDSANGVKKSAFVCNFGSFEALPTLVSSSGSNEVPVDRPNDNDAIADEATDDSPIQETPVEVEEQNGNPEEVKRPFYFLIRIPRYDEESLRDQIRIAQDELEKKSQIRDAIGVELHKAKAKRTECIDNLEAAKLEVKAARAKLKEKRQEMDSAQSVINRVKNALSIDDIDSRIYNLERMIQHETLPLKEEKQLIRDIKQLKLLREQLSSNMGKQEEVQEAMDQRDKIEERLKLLRKEMDIIRDELQKFEEIARVAGDKYSDEKKRYSDLLAQYKAADNLRQEAYSHLTSLKKQLHEKNKHFYTYKDDAAAASEYALNGDRVTLQRHCVNQVEKIMELWNNDDEFRKEYIRCNTRSTLRRLRTLDGRSLGPDEEPPVLPSFANGRVEKSVPMASMVPEVPAIEDKKQVVPMKADDKSNGQAAKTKKHSKSIVSSDVDATVSGSDEIEALTEEPKLTPEEEELARKAEEHRKEEAAAKLKEQQRLEEIAKAKEALERKKRNAEKAQARAELRAHKEAEQKEKEREKKLRKKERKKAAAVDGVSGSVEGESVPGTETPAETVRELEVNDKPPETTTGKRPQVPPKFLKHTKAAPIPLPLRNRNRRKILQQWMWIFLAALAVLALFLVGNSSFFLNFGLRSSDL